MTFGAKISEARKKAGLSQKDLAARIKKEEGGDAISPQYLNDLERDRRNPPSPFMIDQLASVLKIEKEVLYYLAGQLTDDMKNLSADDKDVVNAYRVFRQTLARKQE